MPGQRTLKAMISLLAAGVALSGATAAVASPCANFYAPTGHCYTPVLVSGGITWDEANAAAQAAGGYLATATSAGENQYVFGLVSGNNAYWYLGGFGPWLGGSQESCTPEPSCGWTWVSGEPWSYTNWASGQPDNMPGENKLHFFGGSGGSPAPTWNDWDSVSKAYGYVIEFDRSTCTDPPSNLVSWWAADGGASDLVGSADGTLVNGATYAPGMVGQAFDLSGSQDYVQMAGAFTGNFGANPFTVDFWLLFPPTTGPDNYIVGKSHPDGGQGWDIRLHNQSDGNNRIAVAGVNGWSFNIFSTDLITPNAWHHVALVGAATDVTLYIDGQPQGTSGRQAISTASNPFRVGWTTNYGGSDFNGLLDELEIFDRALSQAEVQTIYSAGSAGKCRSCVTPPSDMVGWWDAEGDAKDSAGTNHGTLVNGTGFAQGKVGQAFSFDGVDDYVEIPNSPSLDITGAITIDAWVKLNQTGYAEIVGKGDANGTPGLFSYGLQISDTGSDGKIVFALYGNYPADRYVTTSDLISPNQWYHVALTWDGTTTNPGNVKLYLNGALAQAWTKTTPLGSNTQSVTIGSMKPPTYFNRTNGVIDEVEIFNRALSAGEIAAIYNAGSAGKCRSYTLDHFLCYKVKRTKGEAKFAKIPGVDLADPFEAKKFDAVKPLVLCNPTDKNGEGISDADTHLKGYQIKLAKTDPRQAKFVKRTNIKVTNQFGTIIVDAVKPDSLLVPTTKSLQGPVDPPDPQQIELDHFKCYKIKPRKNVCLGDPAVRCKSDSDCGQASPCVGKFPKDLRVTLADQFTTPPRLYQVAKPAKLCLPVDKNSEGIKRADDHLMCYQVRPVKKRCQAASPQNALGACKREEDCGGVRDQSTFCGKQPKREKVLRIHTNNQFGPEILDAVKELELCLPSLATLPGID